MDGGLYLGGDVRLFVVFTVPEESDMMVGDTGEVGGTGKDGEDGSIVLSDSLCLLFSVLFWEALFKQGSALHIGGRDWVGDTGDTGDLVPIFKGGR